MEEQIEMPFSPLANGNEKRVNRTECLFPRIAFSQSDTSRWSTIGRDSSSNALSSLHDACASLETTVPALLKAAWALTLARYVSVTNVAFYTAESNGGRGDFGVNKAEWNESTSVSSILNPITGAGAKTDIHYDTLDLFARNSSAFTAALSSVSINTALLLNNYSHQQDRLRDVLKELPQVSTALRIAS
jgi:hypothetical protein